MPARSSFTAGTRKWERLGLAGLVVALVTAGLLLAVDPVDTDDADSRVRAELQVVLDDWAHAVRTGDDGSLAELIDDASPELLDAERERIAAISVVPLADLGYELASEPALPLPPETIARFAADEVRAHRVHLRYAVDGIDDIPTRRPVTVLFVHRPQGWRIADDAPDLAGAQTVTWRGPWDHGSLHLATAQTEGGRSLVIGHPDNAAFVDDLAGDLPSVVEAVDDLWGDSWPRRALVVVTSSHEEFSHLVGPRHDGDDIAAVAVSDDVDHERGIATGQRIVFNPAASDRLDDTSRRIVLAHETVHVAARAGTVDGSPMWVLEGFADYVGHRTAAEGLATGPVDVQRIAPTLTRQVRASGAPTSLPADGDFIGDRSTLAYESSWSIAAYTADQFGHDTLVSLYRALAAGPVTDEHLDDVLTDLLGVDTAGFVGGWGRWLGERIRDIR
ncbi:hypothetical protein CEJ39_16565 [Rhodococcus pyridinivorans]|uniref:hypothetical protein n=1 Tax=Rhodococcus pyridinivorans TaxID=103816 RepID=UPI000301E43C|nr:hypothetical protein [Rhodococcus pyridinivorans]AWZ25567.1 hypothetical protein CEJ39_16565 [Rhodococcus pyridinivorans]